MPLVASRSENILLDGSTSAQEEGEWTSLAFRGDLNTVLAEVQEEIVASSKAREIAARTGAWKLIKLSRLASGGRTSILLWTEPVISRLPQLVHCPLVLSAWGLNCWCRALKCLSLHLQSYGGKSAGQQWKKKPHGTSARKEQNLTEKQKGRAGHEDQWS